MGDREYNLYAFGSNGEGQLGVGAPSDKVLVPRVVPGPPLDIQSIQGGGNHTLILTKPGTVWVAGDNRWRQLGPSYIAHPHVLDSEPPLLEREPTSSGFDRFEKRYEGILFCAAAWESSAYILNSTYEGAGPMILTNGRAHHGELGRGNVNNTPKSLSGRTESVDNGDRFVPWDILDTQMPTSVVDFAAGMYHYVAVLSDGQVWGWGRTRNGQLGTVNRTPISTPACIHETPFPVKRAVCGQNFTYLVGPFTTGEHTILGDDKHGIRTKMPLSVKNWKTIGATWHAIFVLFEDGTLKAWGKEDLWRLVPEGLPEIEQMAVGSDHIIVLTRECKVLSWGWASHGNCGDTSNLDKSLLVKGYVTGGWNEIELPGEAVKVGAGYSTSFVVTMQTDGEGKGV